MKNQKSKILYLITAAAIISVLFVFSSCKNNGDGGREVFSQQGGEYEIMLMPDEWTAVSEFNRTGDLSLMHEPSGAVMILSCYKKTNASGAGISDLNGFINYYKNLETDDNPYKFGTDITAGDLTAVNKSDFKGSVFNLGKNQKISAKYAQAGTENTVEVITEVIYLESKNHYFAIYYSVMPDKLESAQTGANDLISHVRKEK